MKSFLPSLCKLDRSSRQRTKTISQKESQRARFIFRTAAKVTVAGLMFSLGLFAMAKPSEAATTTLSFDQTPTLVSGTALAQGAVYRFPSVTTGVDAMVQIQTIQNAQLKTLDDNTAPFSARFQPVIAPASTALKDATSYVKFNFKLTPSSTASGTSFAAAPIVAATNVYFSAQDIDGNGQSNTIREFVEVIGALTTYLANPTLLQTAAPIFGGTAYEAVDSLNSQSGIGTDDRYEIYSFLGGSVSTFSIVGGNKTGSSGCTLDSSVCNRQNSWAFNVSDIQKLDFGDAPSTFGDAFHSVPPSPTVRLGAAVDGDDGPNYTTAADGDGADDDGVASFPTLATTSTNYSLNLTCAGNGAFVAGWIDFNKNNTFDTGERAAGTCNGTSVTLNWSGISGLTTGNTYARFRISSTASEVTSPTGQAFNGEVEDYQLPITLGSDRSDAPVSYGEAIHTIVNGMKLGAAIDHDAASISNATASGDGADDDGISSFPTLTAGATSYSIPAANINITGTGTLHAWIDFNKNGTFDAGEHTSVVVTSNILAGALSWTGITAGAAGNTFARFRFTSDSTVTAITPSGLASNGEVEDYQVAIAAPLRANVLIVKRITAIKAAGATTASNYNAFETTSPATGNDRNCNWPLTTNVAGTCTNNYILGKIDAGFVKPGDEIEYTIYYLNAGENKAKQARICDRLDQNLSFNTAFDTDPAHVGKGITLVPGIPGVPVSTEIKYLTNLGSDDRGELATTSVSAPVASCNLAANTGTNLSNNVVVVDVGDATNPLMGSTGAGIPITSYGYIRFKTTVK